MASQANIKAVITAEDRASATLKKFSGAVESANDKIVTGAKRAATALTLAGTAAAGFAIKSAADFEQTRIGLENMLGSADKARVLLKDISKFAAETPFEFPELAQATRQLVAFGFTGEEAFETMKQLGNVSAAVGAPINDLAYLMGTLRAQGRAFTIDIRQFAMRGIPIYEYLGKVLNKNTQEITAMIEAGQIGFPEVQKAFTLLAGEGGKWGDTMARQSKSLSGLFSTLKDTLGQTARELIGITQEGDIKEGSAFALLRDAVASLIKNLPTLIAQLKEIVRDIIPQLKQWASNVAEVARQIAEYLGPKIGELWGVIQAKLLPTLERLWRDVLQPLIPVIGTVLVIAIGAAIDILARLISISTGVINIWLNLIQWAKNTGQTVVNVFQWIMDKGNQLKAWFNGLHPAIRGAMVGVADALMGPFDEAFRFIISNAERAVSAVNRLRSASGGGGGSNLVRGFNVLRNVLPGFASGTDYAPGGVALVGEKGPEIVNLPKGSQVVPNSQVPRSQFGGGGTINITVQAGAFMSSQQDARKYAKMIMDAYKDLMAGSGVTV